MVLDFDGKDKVDLSPIDPIAGGVDDVFKWRGTKNFTGNGPEVIYDKKGSKIILFADADGDGKADFSLQFNGLEQTRQGRHDPLSWGGDGPTGRASPVPARGAASSMNWPCLSGSAPAEGRSRAPWGAS